MAMIEKLPVAFSGPYVNLLPKLSEVDPRESAGSVFLYAPGHPSAPVSGAPVTGLTLPNLVSKQAAALLGNAAGTAYPATFTFSAGSAPVRAAAERTGKGGIHVAISKDADVNTQGARFNIADALRAYINTNRGHNWYLSFWDRYTRLSGFGAPSYIEGGGGSSSGDYILYIGNGSSGPNFGGSLTARGIDGAGGNALGNSRKYASGVGKTAAPIFGLGTGFGPTWGAISGNYNRALIDAGQTGYLRTMPSFIAYEWYLEDLTASGRSWSDIDAIDKAEWTKAFAAGGRYASDTFTDPAVLTPAA